MPSDIEQLETFRKAIAPPRVAIFFHHVPVVMRISPELPCGPKRRMPHAINYMHGSSHYNSGLILLNDFREAYSLISCPQFRLDLRSFVEREQREVLFLFRNRDYDPMDYAALTCCMRTYFPWFCNPNGPQARVIWGNKAPFAAANLITGYWATDVYKLKQCGGPAAVAKPAIETTKYMQSGPYIGPRERSCFVERQLARLHHLRVSLRGKRGGMYFVDRRKVYADQFATQSSGVVADEDRAPLLPRHD